MNSHLKISVIMVDGSFRERFNSIDSFSNQTLDPSLYEIIWVEYFSDIAEELRDKEGAYKNFRTILLGKEAPYHSSFCFNRGILEARGELLVIVDADVVVEEDFLEILYLEHSKNKELVSYIYRVNEPKEAHCEACPGLSHLKEVGRIDNPLNFGGCLCVFKTHLLSIGGYDEHMVFHSGFHMNGKDVYTRLKNLGLPIRWHYRLRLYHAWHRHTTVNHLAYEFQKVLIEYRLQNLYKKPAIDIKGNVEEIPMEVLTSWKEILSSKDLDISKHIFNPDLIW